jgi:hypothetical protein
MKKKTKKRKESTELNSQSAWSRPDPRPASRILEEEALLTKPMLAKVLGYKSVRTIDTIVAEDCASELPVLRPVYLRRPAARRDGKSGPRFPSFKSLRFRREDVTAYIVKMQVDFPADLEWKFGKS